MVTTDTSRPHSCVRHNDICQQCYETRQERQAIATWLEYQRSNDKTAEDILDDVLNQIVEMFTGPRAYE